MTDINKIINVVKYYYIYTIIAKYFMFILHETESRRPQYKDMFCNIVITFINITY